MPQLEKTHLELSVRRYFRIQKLVKCNELRRALRLGRADDMYSSALVSQNLSTSIYLIRFAYYVCDANHSDVPP